MKRILLLILLPGLVLLTGCTNPLGKLNTGPTTNKPVVSEPTADKPETTVTPPTPTETPEEPLFEQAGVFLSDRPADDCGEPQPRVTPDTRESFMSFTADGNAVLWSMPYVTFKSADATSPVVFSWYRGEVTEDPRLRSTFAANKNMDRFVTDWILEQTDPARIPTVSCKDQPYVHVQPSLAGATGTWLVPYKLAVSIDHAVVAEAYFYIQQ